jgi:hypothetical protein
MPALALAGVFGAMWLFSLTHFGTEKASAIVFPAAGLLSVGVALYLFMLGLVAEVALSSERDTAHDTPTAVEIR